MAIENNRGLITVSDSRSPISEAYRMLRTNIEYSGIDKKIKTLVITSATANEGKSTVISNLAVVFAKAGKRVLLLDADLRKPSVHRIFHLSNKIGLTNLLLEYSKDKIEMVAQPFTGQDNLYIITAGVIPPNPSELVGSQKMRRFIRDAGELYDMVLIDSPPAGAVTDAAVLSNHADGTLMAIAFDSTKIDMSKQAKALLDNVNANIIGTVMTKVPQKGRGYYGGYYYNASYAYGVNTSGAGKTEGKRRNIKR